MREARGRVRRARARRHRRSRRRDRGRGVGPLRPRARGAVAQPGARRQGRRRRAHAARPRRRHRGDRRPGLGRGRRRRDRAPITPPSPGRSWCAASRTRRAPLSAQDAVTKAGGMLSLPARRPRPHRRGPSRTGCSRSGSRRRRRPPPRPGAPALPQPPAARPGEPHAVRDRVVLVRADRHHRLADRARWPSRRRGGFSTSEP